MCSPETQKMTRKREGVELDSAMRRLRETFIRIRRAFQRQKRNELVARGLS